MVTAAALSAAITLTVSPVAAADSPASSQGPTLGVGDASSYTGGSTSNHPGGAATHGVGDVNSYTGQGTPGSAQNGTNATTRTGNYGPGH